MGNVQFKGSNSKADQRPVQTVRIPFFGDTGGLRTGASILYESTQMYYNCMFEALEIPGSQEKTYYVLLRPGSQTPGSDFSSSTPVGAGRGFFQSADETTFYSVVDANIYNSSGTAIYSSVNNPAGSPLVAAAKTRAGATTQYLAINDGVKLILINNAGAVTVVTTNFPTPNTGDIVYFDGYFFVQKADGTIWNCSVDDPTSWSTTAFITAQMFNGGGVGLVRQGNMLMALSDNSFQMFTDAAIPAPASPLQNADSLAQQVGCVSRQTIAYNENQVFWVSTSDAGKARVVRLSNITKLETISDSTIEKLLETITPENAFGYLLRIGSRTLYVLSFFGILDGTAPTVYGNNITMVYDNDLGVWSRWTGSWNNPTAIPSPYPLFSPVTKFSASGIRTLVQDRSTGRIYSLLQGGGSDFFITPTQGIPFRIQLNLLDFGSNKRKQFVSAEIIGDRSTYLGITQENNILLSYSDNDYGTFSDPRILNLATDRPIGRRLGMGRRRAFRLDARRGEGISPNLATLGTKRLQALEVRYVELDE